MRGSINDDWSILEVAPNNQIKGERARNLKKKGAA